MIFKPEKCSIPDQRMKPFIDPDDLWNLINNVKPTKERVREVIAKSLDKNRLTLEETAVLINANDPELIEEIKQGAKDLKKRVYGNRIVLFAPLYVGNRCINNCTYCGFRTSNKAAVRTTLPVNRRWRGADGNCRLAAASPLWLSFSVNHASAHAPEQDASGVPASSSHWWDTINKSPCFKVKLVSSKRGLLSVLKLVTCGA